MGAGNLALGAGKMGLNMAYAPVKLAKGAMDGARTPDKERKSGDQGGDYFGSVNKSRDGYTKKVEETTEEREKREWEKEKRRRRKAKEKKRQEEIFVSFSSAHGIGQVQAQMFGLSKVT